MQSPDAAGPLGGVGVGIGSFSGLSELTFLGAAQPTCLPGIQPSGLPLSPDNRPLSPDNRLYSSKGGMLRYGGSLERLWNATKRGATEGETSLLPGPSSTSAGAELSLSHAYATAVLRARMCAHVGRTLWVDVRGSPDGPARPQADAGDRRLRASGSSGVRTSYARSSCFFAPNGYAPPSVPLGGILRDRIIVTASVTAVKLSENTTGIL
jgi:hypothetical protein